MASARFAFTIILFSIVYAKSFADINSRILGGNGATSGALPYAASLRINNGHKCGATILDANHLLTAATCVHDDDGVTAIPVGSLSVRVGSTNQFAGGYIAQIVAVNVHPEYEGFKNNIAILETEPLTLSAKVASLPIASAAADQPAENDEVVAAGWGLQDDDATAYKLNYLPFKVASDANCLDAYSDADSSVICLSHDLQEGSCTGDGGNAAVYNGKVVGICSFVVGACGARYPEVFVNVYHYADWIEDVLSNDSL